jgi:hypothetical protein
MKKRLFWSNILIIVGIIFMLIGAIDPLEGSIIILPGSGIIALGTFLSNSRYRQLLLWSFILVAIGVSTLWGLSAIGGLGGSTGRSVWWSLILIPYPIGWIMGIIGAILRLRESHRAHAI